jgi:menaquinone reductase, multiheme cytochrome c subunit
VRSRGIIVFAAGLLAALGVGWLGFPKVLYQRTPQPLQFSHAVHTGEKAGMKCEDCHSLRDDGSFSGIPALEKCAGCHSAPLGTTPAEKQLVEQFVTPNREIPWAVYSRQPENVWFSHAPHLKLAKLECKECHGEHGKTDKLRPYERNRISGYSRDIWGQSISRMGWQPRRGMKMDDCVDCHHKNGQNYSCMDCHK